MKQIKLTIDLEGKKLHAALDRDQTRELVLLIAQAIVAVHRARRDGEEAPEEDDDVDDE